MKSKYFFVILFLILAMFLSGCGGLVTPATDEAKVKNVIQNYYLAINDQNWSKVKSYCIYGSDQYYKVSLMEDAANVLQQYYGTVTITCFADISNVSVSGSYASAYINVTVVVTAGIYYDTYSDSGYLYLQKVGNSWKLY
ncbi:MAG: hypothetical protein KAV97_01585 [Actinomycetia bacterium]|nr:hypothetical protein [Actinomycetes bacterium]